MNEMLEFFKGIIFKVSTKEKAFFSRQLATMLSSGLPLTQSLYILSIQTQNQIMKSALESTIRDLEAGYSLSAALKKHPQIFNRVYISIVVSGEASGKLDKVLEELSGQLENESSFSSKIRSAMVYPAFIFLAMVGVMVLMLVKVIPQLQTIFKEAGASLPFATRILIVSSEFLISYWWVAIISIIILVIAVRLVLGTETGSYFWNRFQIGAPLIKSISQNVYMARFTRTLGMLIHSGLPIIEALTITSEVMNNDIYRDELNEIASQVERGIPMSVPMSKNPYFPLLVSQMVMVGEQTGKLDQILTNLAKYYEEESDNKVKALSSLFEPITIVIIGGGVAFVVFSILMPIYNIAQIQQ